MTSLQLVLWFATAGLTVESRHSFFRHDYIYVEEFDTFYKFHLRENSAGLNLTYQACEEEGAELFYPETLDEWTVVKKVMDKYPYSPVLASITNVFVGIRKKIAGCEFSIMNVHTKSALRLGFETFGDGNCVVLDIYSGFLYADYCVTKTETKVPFLCKKKRHVAKEDPICPTNGYQYSNETGKCYKVHLNEKNWCNAMETCLNEGSQMLVVKSATEASIIKNIIPLNYTSFFVGARRTNENETYLTITGHEPSTDGFYNIIDDYKKEDCWSVWTSSTALSIFLATDDCTLRRPFICEINSALN